MRVVAALALLGLAAGCGGSSASSLGSVSKNDLAIMVLPAAEYGALANGARVDRDSGFQDAEAVAEDTLDPDDAASDIEAAGVEADYELAYTTSGSQLSSEIALLGSAEEAQALVGEKIGEAEQYEGTELPGGATVSRVEVEELDFPGDAAWRARATAKLGATEVTTSLLAFTVDQVAAVVRVTKLGDVASDEELDGLASALADRIQEVADGEISDTPVPIPTETTQTTATQDPALERMVLSLEDLPSGVSIEQDGFVTDGGDVSFEREFALGNATIGRSELIGLSSNAERTDSAAAAKLAVRAVPGIVRGAAGKQLFSQAFAEGAGFDAESLEIEELPGERIGDEATVLHATFDTRAGPFEAVFVFIAEGTAAGQIYAAGAKGNVSPEDILALARTMAAKMEAEQ